MSDIINTQNPNSLEHLQDAFRKAHFLDHAFPVLNVDTESRAHSLELSMIAYGLGKDSIDLARREGLIQSVGDYSDYLEGGVKELQFDDQFKLNITQRIQEARRFRATHN